MNKQEVQRHRFELFCRRMGLEDHDLIFNEHQNRYMTARTQWSWVVWQSAKEDESEAA